MSTTCSGVPRVSSARGPMLGSAPPPPRLVNPASAPGEKIDKQKKNRQAKQKKKKKKVFSTKKTPREIGALESSGPIAFAPLKFAPTSWAGASSKACARGPWPPCPPPPRYATDYLSAKIEVNCQTFLSVVKYATCI